MKMQNPFVAVAGTLVLCIAFSAAAAQPQSSSGRPKAGQKGKTGMAEELVSVFSKTGKTALKDFVVAMKDGVAENPLNVPGVDVLFGGMAKEGESKVDDATSAHGKIIPEPEWMEFSKEISFKDAACRLGDFATPLVASWKGGGGKGIKDAKVTVRSATGVIAGSVAYGVIKAGTVVKKSEAASAVVGAGLVAVSLGLMIEDKNGDYDSKDEKSNEDFDAIVTILSNGELSVRCMGQGKNKKDEKGM